MEGTTVGGSTVSNLGQATIATFMAAATRSSSTLNHDADFYWVELFSSYLFHLLFNGVM